MKSRPKIVTESEIRKMISESEEPSRTFTQMLPVSEFVTYNEKGKDMRERFRSVGIEYLKVRITTRGKARTETLVDVEPESVEGKVEGITDRYLKNLVFLYYDAKLENLKSMMGYR